MWWFIVFRFWQNPPQKTSKFQRNKNPKKNSKKTLEISKNCKTPKNNSPKNSKNLQKPLTLSRPRFLALSRPRFLALSRPCFWRFSALRAETPQKTQKKNSKLWNFSKPQKKQLKQTQKKLGASRRKPPQNRVFFEFPPPPPKKKQCDDCTWFLANQSIELSSHSITGTGILCRFHCRNWKLHFSFLGRFGCRIPEIRAAKKARTPNGIPSYTALIQKVLRLNPLGDRLSSLLGTASLLDRVSWNTLTFPLVRKHILLFAGRAVLKNLWTFRWLWNLRQFWIFWGSEQVKETVVTFDEKSCSRPLPSFGICMVVRPYPSPFHISSSRQQRQGKINHKD